MRIFRIMLNTYKNSEGELKQAQEQTNGSAEPLPRLAYTMRETAAILGVSYITVHRLLQRGKLRASDALRSKIISRAEIERFLRESSKAGGNRV